ncbi:MAG: hypothetical protein HC799_00035 [Limnothrix sp. RL_2_0]|nr:hypothetical protein [Limnothrix sp. RL_2_0]
MCLALTGNTVTNPGNFGFNFTSTGVGSFQVLDRANLLTNNLGTFNPGDITINANFTNGLTGVAPCP